MPNYNVLVIDARGSRSTLKAHYFYSLEAVSTKLVVWICLFHSHRFTRAPSEHFLEYLRAYNKPVNASEREKLKENMVNEPLSRLSAMSCLHQCIWYSFESRQGFVH